MIEIGKMAPNFALPDQDGNIVTLESLKGAPAVLYFYPRDNTSGCTKQACAYRDRMGEFAELGVRVLGISKDSPASHTKFIQKQSLNFTLLSDTELGVLQDYGVWQEKKLYGKVSYGVVRTTYVIDEEGKVIAVFPKVKPEQDPDIILDFLKSR